MLSIDQLKPVPKNSGFAMDNYWIGTGGSIVQGEDGLYHMFTSRFPKTFPFYPYWLTNYETVRAVSKNPEGPYEFAEVIKDNRLAGEEYWNGMAIWSTVVQRHKDQWVMFYTGSTYHGGRPLPENAVSCATEDLPQAKESHARQRIGVATASSVLGPWKHLPEPILAPRSEQGYWDSYKVSNPAPCILEDGSCLLMYKAIGYFGGTMQLGVAKSEHFTGPYERISEGPVFELNSEQPVEDPFVWWNGKDFEVILRDWRGTICGEIKAGVHGWSSDGVNWQLSEKVKVWSKTIHWDDGTSTTMRDVEVPKLFFNENGIPTHLAVTVREGGSLHEPNNLRILVIPLKCKNSFL